MEFIVKVEGDDSPRAVETPSLYGRMVDKMRGYFGYTTCKEKNSESPIALGRKFDFCQLTNDISDESMTSMDELFGDDGSVESFECSVHSYVSFENIHQSFDESIMVPPRKRSDALDSVEEALDAFELESIGELSAADLFEYDDKGFQCFGECYDASDLVEAGGGGDH